MLRMSMVQVLAMPVLLLFCDNGRTGWGLEWCSTKCYLNCMAFMRISEN